MSNRHFVESQDIATLVPDALEALTFQNPALSWDSRHKSIYDKGHDPDRHVSVVSGGGAGHEPAHAMYVGAGMLSAAVSGNIFASSSVPQIYNCVRNASGKAGTVLIVKNYTGDNFHFSQAALKARVDLGARVEVVTVGDDVSLTRSKVSKVGRRGLAGTVLMHKVIGAMAAQGKSVDECLTVSKVVNAGLATIGASLGRVQIPGQPCASNQVPETAIELGMGIHNESGAQLLQPRPSLSDLLDLMLQRLLDTSDPERGYVDFGISPDNVVVMVNNLGSLSVLELSAITTKVVRKLGERGIRPRRVYSGSFMTSLDGPGFSITCLRVDAEILSYLDAPTSALGWTSSSTWDEPETRASRTYADEAIDNRSRTAFGGKVDPSVLRKAISGACHSALEAVPAITHFDTIVGDGDCGLTLQRGCETVLKLFEDGVEISDSAFDNFVRIAHAVEESMDGTSGAIYGLFFNGFSAKLRDSDVGGTISHSEWLAAATAGLEAVQGVTPARAGDRTLMDALEPFIHTLKDGLSNAVREAQNGAETTKGMKPAFGRAVYVNEDGWDQVPDPGAMGVVAIVEGLGKVLIGKSIS
ncbi:hypothetical protein CDV31_012632 [Fusarium ambrosium]|uniref:Dihydroxyacetone kinase n=1 Tax=Fusarium ambrosium TaxID=131363 RepID=A0A428T8H9_9HYPO|nr:hypothetical protein CDV31_012632 [Fusarium ambrosium]